MGAGGGKIYVSDEMEIDTARLILLRAGEPCSLRPKTFSLLVYLIENRDRLVPKDELIERLWPGVAVSDGALAQCIAEIRRLLGEDSRDARYIRTVPRRGYQFIAPVSEKAPESAGVEEPIEDSREMNADEPPAAPVMAGPKSRGAWLRAAVACAVSVLGAALLMGWRGSPGPAPVGIDDSVVTALMPFENRSSGPQFDWLRTGLPDMLATSLSRSGRLALISPVQLQRSLPHSPTGAIALEDALSAARRAKARVMITGAVASIGKSLRVDAQIYDVETGRLTAGETFTVDQPSLLLSQVDPLAAKLVAHFGAPSSDPAHLGEEMTNNLEAYRLYSLGLARTREMRLPEAIALYNQALELDPGFAMAYARIGFTYSSTWARTADGKPYLEKAYRLSDRLTARDRLFIRAWYALACRDYESAERAYREMLVRFPMEIESYHALGALLAGSRRYDEARKIMEQGLAIDADMPQLHNLLSETYFSLGQRERGLASAQRYVALSGEPNAQDTLGNVYQQMGRYEEARAAYLKALELKPDFEIAILHLGNVYFQLGRYREALEQYRRYIRIAPSDNERIRGHGSAFWLYWRKGDFANAESEAREASRLKQGDVREILLFNADLGRVHLTEQLREDILRPSILAGRGARENLRIPYFIAGYIALRSHNNEQAVQDFRASLNEPSIYWNIDPLETCLADALLEMGRLDDAIAEYRRILSVDGNYPMALYRLSLALSRKGLTREANAALQRFLMIWQDADPDVPELVEAKKRGLRSQASVAEDTAHSAVRIP